MARRSPVPLVVLACAFGALVAGCGGDSGAETSKASPEALAKVSASDYARSVNLRQSDVPYFEVVSDDGDDVDPEAEERRQREAQKCMGMEAAVEPLAEVNSPSFEMDAPGTVLSLESTVSVERDSVDVAGEFRHFQSRLALRCMRELFLGVLEEEETIEIDAAGATVRRLPYPGPETDDTYAFRFKSTFTVSEDRAETVAYQPGGRAAADPLSLDVYVDLLGFASGQAVVSLAAIGMPSPVSRNFERNLLRVLRERATAREP